MKRVKDEQAPRFVAQKRQAIDGKNWWVVYDNKYHKYSTYTCFGKYKTKQECEWAIDYYSKEWNLLSDSRKIKDAEEDTPAVLDGILLIAFNDGEEEDGYNAVKQHANERGELDGVQYETYDTDYQDGVTLIDLCAMTDDANAFVKALLNEWGVIESVADIEFEASDNMKEAISDSRRVKDGLDEPLPYTDEHPASDWEYWGVKETTIKKLKAEDWFTLKPIPEPKESQVWIKKFYNREDRTYTCTRYDGGGERYFKGDRKVYVDFYF